MAQNIYSPYAPSELYIESIFIGVSYETNSNLRLDNPQHLIVGERVNRDPTKDNTYALIADETGIGVNTTIPIRSANQGQYALYVDGNAYITGHVISEMGTVVDGNNISTNPNGFNPWLPNDNNIDNIWFSGTTTIGQNYDASNNGYAVNIVKSGDRTIDHAQISMQNNQYAQMRFAIIGSAPESPAIINTPPGTGLEFHMGRDQYYFQKMYSKSNYGPVYDETLERYVDKLIITNTETPNYNYYNSSNAPHIIIDPIGNVGIHTSSNIQLTYQLRIPNQYNPENIIYPMLTESMALHVEGSVYSKNLLIYDYQSGMPKHIDELYVRRLGVTIPANQINPGTFGNGDYSFTSNLNILAGDVTINGNEHVFQDLSVDGTATLNQIIATDAILLDVASFCNDVYINRDMIINQAVRIRGQIYTEILSNVEIDGRSNYAWQMINFSPAQPSYSNINIMGQGISTPGRLGVGIDPTADAVNNQFSIFKRDPNIYEIELYDLSDPTYVRWAFIGHPTVAPSVKPDGSLVIMTPDLRHIPNSSVYPNGVAQNIYFFPGADISPTAAPIIRSDNLPTLAIFTNNRVSIGGTYSPLSTLDVRGTITFSGDLIYNDLTNNVLSKVGLWKSKQFASTKNGQHLLFQGIQFLNSDSTNVAININPEPGYALVIGNGGLKSYDGYYDLNDYKIAEWIETSDESVHNFSAKPIDKQRHVATFGNVGIGVPNPQADLEIKNNFNTPTTLRLVCGDAAPTSSNAILEFAGVNDSWFIQSDDAFQRLEIGYGADTFTSDINARAMWMQYNPSTDQQQVFIGEPISSITAIDPRVVLNVGGNMAVNGDVNITGNFRINSRTVVNEAVMHGNSLPFAPDDIYIGGGNIVIQPNAQTSKGLIVGDPASDKNGTDTALFRVYQQTANAIMATFRSSTAAAYIQVLNTSGNGIIFGLANSSDPTSAGVKLTFMDENYLPYMSFKSPPNSQNRYVGFNTNNPSSLIHIYTANSGANMLRLTKAVSSQYDTNSACAQIDLEKSYTNNTFTRWTIQGPNYGYNQRLGFVYQDPNTTPTELFSFTNDGCIGIGVTTPQYSLDVANTGKKGSLRLLNTDVSGAPQLLFQCADQTFGSIASFDFRMATSNSEFLFDMQDIYQNIPILNVNSNGHIGMRGMADPSYDLSINGRLNVATDISVAGRVLFSSTNSALDSGFPIVGANIFLKPSITSTFKGGVVINSLTPTSNLLHIYSGRNANMCVFDSAYSEAQIHFRNNVAANGGYINNMYRMSMSNTQFQWEYWPNCISGSEILSEHTEYNTVISWAPSLRQNATNEFDTVIDGCLTLNSAIPSIFLNNNGMINGSNNAISIIPNNNIGFGTTAPNYFTHIFNQNNVATLHLDNKGQSNAFEVNTNNLQQFTIDVNGNVGIGSTLPIGALNINGQILMNTGSGSGIAQYSFANASNSGIYSTNSSNIGIVCGGSNILTAINQKLNVHVPLSVYSATTNNSNIFSVFKNYNQTVPYLTVASNGCIGIGTVNPQYPLTLNGNAGITGNIYPTANAIYDLGSSTMRWRDIYLSGNSIDLDGTKIKRNANDGSIALRDNNGLQRLVANDIQIGDSTTPSIIYIQSGAYNNIQFTSVNNSTGNSVQFTPLFLNNDALDVGIANGNGALHVVSRSNLTGAIIDQASTGDVLQLYANSTQRLVTVKKNGNVGIGTSSPIYPFVVSANNSSYSAMFQQSNINGNVATFQNAVGNSININSQGYLGVNTMNPQNPLHVSGSQFFDGPGVFNSSVTINTNLTVIGDAVAHGNQVVDSDYRLKTDLNRIENALDKVKTLTGYTFTKIDTGKLSTGLIAQEVQAILPEAVTISRIEKETGTEYLGLAYGNLMGLIVEAIKELSIEVESIKSRLV